MFVAEDPGECSPTRDGIWISCWVDQALASSDGNYGSLKGAGSSGSVPFKEPFKRAVFFLKGGGVTRFICEIITRIMIDCNARPK